MRSTQKQWFELHAPGLRKASIGWQYDYDTGVYHFYRVVKVPQTALETGGTELAAAIVRKLTGKTEANG
jgi:hypothetical protein